MPRLRRSILLAGTTVPALVLLASGCGLLRSGPKEPSPSAAARAADTCPPLRVDKLTAEQWGDALADFIDRQQMQSACVLVRTPQCLQDPPANVVERLRKKSERARPWPLLCQAGTPVLTLIDETIDGDRKITVGDGFDMTCAWEPRRSWFPGQSQLKLVDCVKQPRRR